MLLAFDVDSEIIKAFGGLLKTIVDSFGPGITVFGFVFICLLFIARRLYNDHMKDREVNLAIQKLEEALQRANSEAREWRVLFLKEKCGWDNDTVEKFVLKNEFPDGPTARNALESKETPQPPPKKSPQRRKGRR